MEKKLEQISDPKEICTSPSYSNLQATGESQLKLNFFLNLIIYIYIEREI